jgi:MFS transporter, FSR family, fosmidomycin resistance protein
MDTTTNTRLRAAIGGHFLVDLYSPILPIILPALITSLNLSYLMAGIIVTVFNITSSIIQPVSGLYSDRTKRSVSIPVCVLFSCLGISLAVLTSNYYIMLALVSGAAIGTALFHPAAMDSVYRLSPPHKRGLYNSIFTTSGSVSYSISPFIAGVLITYFGLSSITWFAIPGIIGAAWIYGVEKRSPEITESVSSKSEFKPIVDRKQFWWASAGLVVVLCSLRAWAYIGIITYLPTLLILGHYGMDTVTTSLIVTIMLLTGVGGQVAGGMLSDRFGRKRMLILGFVCAIPFFGMIFLTQGWAMYAGIFMYAFFASFCYVTSVTMVQELLPGSVGFASGLTLGLCMGMGGIGAAIIGWAADLMGSLPHAMFLLIIPTILCPILAVFIKYPEDNPISV